MKYKIYGDKLSGNCLKVKYLSDLMDLDYQWVDVNILKGESRQENFLSKSKFGQVPLLELEDGRVLAQSNAILRYLARGSDLLPKDDFLTAKVDEWLFWEQYSHEPYIAVSMFQMFFLKKKKNEREAWRVERGELALDLMEAHLAENKWFVGEDLTIADIALYAYTGRCHLGGFDLVGRPHLTAWIDRCSLNLSIDI